MSLSASDSQLMEQLRFSAETVCSTFHVPGFKIGIGPPPTYTNIEALNQGYYSDCLQNLIESLELCLDEGLELKKSAEGLRYGTEFDLHDLLRMDTATKATAAQTAIGSGAMSPNEARFRFFDLGPVDGGDTPYMQEQNWPLRQLSSRPLPIRPPTAPAPLPPAPEPSTKATAAFFGAELQRRVAA